MKCRFKSYSTCPFLGPEVPRRDYSDIYYIKAFSVWRSMSHGVRIGYNILTGYCGEIEPKPFGLRASCQPLQITLNPRQVTFP